MTEPTDPTSSGTPPDSQPDAAPDAAPGAAPSTPEPGPAAAIDPGLLAYVRANRATVTEGALRQAAIAAGHAPGAVDAALAATRDVTPPADRGRAFRNIFLAYLGVYLILSALMLVNPANRGSGFLGDRSGIGVAILSMSLGAAFVGSLVWIASRRLFVALLGVIIGLSGVATLLSSFEGGNVVGALIGVPIGAGLILAAVYLDRRPGVAASPSMALLMTLPLLALVVIGGICVASGLPIPRPA